MSIIDLDAFQEKTITFKLNDENYEVPLDIGTEGTYYLFGKEKEMEDENITDKEQYDLLVELVTYLFSFKNDVDKQFIIKAFKKNEQLKMVMDAFKKYQNEEMNDPN